jgi:N12 class adenine-specific DNA methylase/GGDEF domain-containing protein
MADLRELLNDPEFILMPRKDRLQIINQIAPTDSTFASLAPEEQQAVISRLLEYQQVDLRAVVQHPKWQQMPIEERADWLNKNAGRDPMLSQLKPGEQRVVLGKALIAKQTPPPPDMLDLMVGDTQQVPLQQRNAKLLLGRLYPPEIQQYGQEQLIRSAQEAVDKQSLAEQVANALSRGINQFGQNTMAVQHALGLPYSPEIESGVTLPLEMQLKPSKQQEYEEQAKQRAEKVARIREALSQKLGVLGNIAGIPASVGLSVLNAVEGAVQNPKGTLLAQAEQLPISLPPMVMGGMVASALGPLAPALSKFVAYGVSSAIPEALSEAGDTYLQARQSGMSHAEARNAFAKDFASNLVLLSTSNSLEAASAFGGLKALAGGEKAIQKAVEEAAKKTAERVAKTSLMQQALDTTFRLLGTGAEEGFEEYAQAGFQQAAQAPGQFWEKLLNPSQREELERMTQAEAGAALGMAFGAAGATKARLEDAEARYEAFKRSQEAAGGAGGDGSASEVEGGGVPPEGPTGRGKGFTWWPWGRKDRQGGVDSERTVSSRNGQEGMDSSGEGEEGQGGSPPEGRGPQPPVPPVRPRGPNVPGGIGVSVESSDGGGSDVVGDDTSGGDGGGGTPQGSGGGGLGLDENLAEQAVLEILGQGEEAERRRPFTAELRRLRNVVANMAQRLNRPGLARAALTAPLAHGFANATALQLHERLFPESEPGVPFFTLAFDARGFKNVNDHLGQDAGDALIETIAAEMADVLDRYASTGFRVFAARPGGDEFVVRAGLSSQESAEALAAKIAEVTAPEVLMGKVTVIPQEELTKYYGGLRFGIGRTSNDAYEQLAAVKGREGSFREVVRKHNDREGGSGQSVPPVPERSSSTVDNEGATPPSGPEVVAEETEQSEPTVVEKKPKKPKILPPKEQNKVRRKAKSDKTAVQAVEEEGVATTPTPTEEKRVIEEPRATSEEQAEPKPPTEPTEEVKTAKEPEAKPTQPTQEVKSKEEGPTFERSSSLPTSPEDYRQWASEVTSQKAGNIRSSRRAWRDALLHGVPAKSPAPQTERYRGLPAQSRSYNPETVAASNLAAIKLIKQLEAEDRGPTDEELAILQRFRGWGGLSGLFSASTEKLYQMYKELENLLGRSVVSAIRSTVLNSHYTDPVIAMSIWDGLKRALEGYKELFALEPAVGSGIFIATSPEDITFKWHATDIDPIATKVTKVVTEATGIPAIVENRGFETLSVPDGSFDLVITNVPFGDYKLYEKRYNHLELSIHNHFIVKSLDLVRPGGLVVVITSRYTMDSKSQKARQEMYQRADLVTAIRLPQEAHAFAGTRVVTDILVFRRRKPGELPGDATWLSTEEVEIAPKQTVDLNSYWADHKDHILGHAFLGRGLYSDNEYVVATYNPEKIPEQITDLFSRDLQQGIFAPEDIKSELASIKSSISGNYLGGIVHADGKLYRVKKDRLTDREEYHEIGPASADDIKRLKALDALYQALDNVIRVAKDGIPSLTEDALEKLKAAYNEFNKSFGLLRFEKNMRFLQLTEHGKALFAIDHPNGIEHTKFFTTQKSILGQSKLRRIEEAIPIIALRSDADIVDILARSGYEELAGKSKAEIVEYLSERGLAYFDPEERKVVPAFMYLSGDIRHKLEIAKKNAETNPLFKHNAQALERVLPPWKSFQDIPFRLGSSFLDKELVAGFLQLMLMYPDRYASPSAAEIVHDLVVKARDLGQSVKDVPELVARRERRNYWLRIRTNRVNGVTDVEFTVENSRDFDRALKTFFDTRVSKSIPEGRMQTVLKDFFFDLLNGTRTFHTPFTARDFEGSEEYRRDQARSENEQFNAAMEQLYDEALQGFRSFVEGHNGLRQYVEERYNSLLNSYVAPKPPIEMLKDEDDGAYRVPGMSKDSWLRPYQAESVVKTVFRGSQMIAHEVGLGKTYVLLSTAAYAKHLGIARKPVIAVPKATIRQFAEEARRSFPGLTILSSESVTKGRETLQSFLAVMAASDFDIAIITHEHLTQISPSPEYIQQVFEEIDAQISDAIRAASGDRRLVKRLQKEAQRFERTFRYLEGRAKKSGIFTLDKIGIDFLFVDEAHFFKSYPLFVLQNVKGVPTTKSQRSVILDLLIRNIKDRRQSDTGIVLATGTPIANTLPEAYIMARLVSAEELSRINVNTINNWLAAFAAVDNDVEVKATGEIDVVERLSLFVDPAAFRRALRTSWSVELGEDHEDILQRPRKEQIVIEVTPTPIFQKFLLSLQERAQAIKRGDVRPEEDNFLYITTDASKASVDLRLVSKDATEEDGVKLRAVADNVARLYSEFPGTAQLIFLDRGISRTSWGFSAYEELIRQLVKLGIPREEIIDFSKLTQAKRKDAEEGIRSGKYRVAIGSTRKLGTGLNVQDVLVAVHHVDASWVPADMEQREGRIWRSGNKSDVARIFTYVTKGSLDTLFYKALHRKSSFIKQFLKDGALESVVESIPDQITYDDIAAVAAADKRLITLAQLQKELKKLTLRRKAQEDKVTRTGSSIAEAQRSLRVVSDAIRDYEETLKLLTGQKDIPANALVDSIDIDVDEKDPRKLIVQYYPGMDGFDELLPRLREKFEQIKQRVREQHKRMGDYDVSFIEKVEPRAVRTIPAERKLHFLSLFDIKVKYEAKEGAREVRESMSLSNQRDEHWTPLMRAAGAAWYLPSHIAADISVDRANLINRVEKSIGPVAVFRAALGDATMLQQGLELLRDVEGKLNEYIEKRQTSLEQEQKALAEAKTNERQVAQQIDDVKQDIAANPHVIQSSDASFVRSSAQEVSEEERSLEEAGIPEGEGDEEEGEETPPEGTRGVPQKKLSVASEEAGISIELTAEKERHGVSRADIIRYVQDKLVLRVVRPAHMKLYQKKYAALYDVDADYVSLAFGGDTDALAHEIGHAFWNRFKIKDALPSKEAIEEMQALGRELYRDPDMADDLALEEGFAEVFKAWLFGDEALHKAAPAAGSWLSSFIDELPEYSKDYKDLRDMFDAFRRQGTRERMLRQLGMYRPSFAERIRQAYQKLKIELPRKQAKFRRRWLDRYAAIRDIVDAVSEVTQLTAEKDPYKLARAFSMASRGIAKQWVLDGVVDPFTGQHLFKSLRDAFEPAFEAAAHLPTEEVAEDVILYGIAQYTLERAGRGQKTGVYVADANEMLRQLAVKYQSKIGVIEQAARDVTAWNHAVIDWLAYVGSLTQEQAERIKGSFAFYVPMLRAFKEYDETTVKREGKPGGRRIPISTVRRFKGSKRETINPLDAMVFQTERFIDAGIRTRIAIAFRDLAEKTPMHGWWMAKVPRTDQAKLKFKLGRVVEEIEKQFGTELDEVFDEQELDAFLTLWANHPAFLDPKEPIIVFRDRGKTEFWRINDQDLLDTLRESDELTIGSFLRTLLAPLGRLARLQRLGATGLNPGFTFVTALLRDVWDAFMVTKWTAKAYPRRTFEALQELVLQTLGKDSPAAKAFKEMGAEMTTLMGLDRRVAKDIRDSIMLRAKTTKGKVKFIIMHPVDSLRAFFGGEEIALRLPEFSKTYEEQKAKGASEQTARIEALLAAKEVTLDFSKAGVYARFLNNYIPFFNAAIRDIDRFVSSMRTNPRKVFWRAFLSITVPSIILYLMNSDEDWYDEIPEWERALFIHIKIGEHSDGKPFVLRIPYPFTFGLVFGAFPVMLLRTLHKGSNDVDWQRWKQTVMEKLLPPTRVPLISTIYDLAVNKGWTGQPIVPEGLAKVEDKYQFLRNTSEFYKWIGEMTGLSPLKVQYAVRDLTGGLSETFTNPLKARREMADWPVIGRLFMRNERFGKSYQELYDDLKKAEEAYNTILRLRKMGEIDKAVKVALDNAELLGFKDTDFRIAMLRRSLELRNRDFPASFYFPNLKRLREQADTLGQMTREGSSPYDITLEARKMRQEAAR